MKKIVFTYLLAFGSTVLLAQEKTILLPDVSVSIKLNKSELRLDSNLLLVSCQSLGNGLRLFSDLYIKNYGGGGSSTLSIRGTAASHSTVIWKGIPIGNPMLGSTDLSLFSGPVLEGAYLQVGGTSKAGFSGNFGGQVVLGDNPETKSSAIRMGSSIGSFSAFQQWATASQSIGKLKVDLKIWNQTAENNFTYQFENQHKKKFHSANEDRGLLLELSVPIAAGWQWQPAVWIQKTNREIGPSVFETHADATQLDESFRMVNDWKKKTENSEWTFKQALSQQRLNYLSPSQAIDSKNGVTEQFYSVINNRKIGRYKIGFQALQTISKTNSNNYSGKPDQWKTEGIVHATSPLFFEKIQVNAQVQSVFYRHSSITNQGLLFLPSISGTFIDSLPGEISLGIHRKARIPSLNDLFWAHVGNPSLNPENGWTAEMDWKKSWRIFSFMNLKSSASLFKSQINNYIQWVPVSALWQPHNLAEVEITGINFQPELSFHVGKWTLGTITRFQQTRSIQTKSQFDGDESVGNQLIYIPKLNAIYGLSLQKGGFSGVVWLENCGRRYIDTENDRFLPSYRLVNFRLSFQSKFSSQINFQTYLEAINLTGASYQSVVGYPMPLQQFKFGLQLYFKQK